MQKDADKDVRIEEASMLIRSLLQKHHSETSTGESGSSMKNQFVLLEAWLKQENEKLREKEKNIGNLLAVLSQLGGSSNPEIPGHTEEPMEVLLSGLRAMTNSTDSQSALVKEKDAQVNTIFNHAPDAVVVMREDGTIDRWNTAAQNVFGWREDEVKGRYVHEVVIPEIHRKRHIEGLARFLATGETRVINKTVEVPALRKDGSEIHIELTISAAKLQHKYLFIAFMRDITNRKRAEMLIRELNAQLEKRVEERTAEAIENEKKYRNLFENNPIPLWVLDRSTLGFLDVNESALEKYGYSKEEFLSLNSVDLRPADERQRYLALHRPRTGTQNTGVWKHMKKDGTIIYVEVFVHEILFEGKEARLVLAIDITQRRNAEAQILELNQSLEQRVARRTEELQLANKELESFSYSVSHDLRAPLRAINGYSQMLEEDYGPQLDSEAIRLLRLVKSNASKMGQLVDDLLAFSRIGKRDLMMVDTDMNGLIANVIDELEPNDRARTNFIVHSLPTAAVDATLFHNVFQNLIANAVKYSSKKRNPTVEIGTTGVDKKLVYFVRDNGAGFNMAYYDKLFGVFQRLHGHDQFEGTGVGLAIVQRIVVRHGGRVWAEAVENEGATFYFTLNQPLKP